MDESYYDEAADPTWFDKMNITDKLELYDLNRQQQRPPRIRSNVGSGPFSQYRNTTASGFLSPIQNTPVASQYDIMLDKMDAAERETYFGGYSREPKPPYVHPDANFVSFYEYRSNDIDGFSSDGNTLAASEYNNSFGTIETGTTFCSPIENLNDSMGPWPSFSPSAGSVDVNLIDAIVGEFRNRSSIVSARPSPNLAPQFDLEDIEGLEALSAGNSKEVAKVAGLAEGTSSSLYDSFGRERFKKLKRSVEKYSEILDASGSDSQEDHAGERTISASRGRERPRIETAFDNRQNAQPTRSRRTTGYNREPVQRDPRVGGNAIPLINTIPPSQGNHGGQRTSNTDKHPRKRTRHAPAFRPLEPKSGPHHVSSVPDPAHPTQREPVPRPANGEFKCTVIGCTRRYNRSENLCRHLRVDHRHPKVDYKPSDVRLMCPECGAMRSGGRAQENMNTHMRDKHGFISHV